MSDLVNELKAMRVELEAIRAEQAEILKYNGELMQRMLQLSTDVKELSGPLVSVE